MGEVSLTTAHTEPVFKTMWVSSKTGAEFFTASSDGRVSPGLTAITAIRAITEITEITVMIV